MARPLPPPAIASPPWCIWKTRLALAHLEQVGLAEWADMPESYECPITHEVFQDPSSPPMGTRMSAVRSTHAHGANSLEPADARAAEMRLCPISLYSGASRATRMRWTESRDASMQRTREAGALEEPPPVKSSFPREPRA